MDQSAQKKKDAAIKKKVDQLQRAQSGLTNNSNSSLDEIEELEQKLQELELQQKAHL